MINLNETNPETLFGMFPNGLQDYGINDTDGLKDGTYVPFGTFGDFRPLVRSVGMTNISQSESGNIHFIEVTLPGFNESEVSVTLVDDNVLLIEAVKKEVFEGEGMVFTSQEFKLQDFTKMVDLPPELIGAETQISLDKGILTIGLIPTPIEEISTKLF